MGGLGRALTAWRVMLGHERQAASAVFDAGAAMDEVARARGRVRAGVRAGQRGRAGGGSGAAHLDQQSRLGKVERGPCALDRKGEVLQLLQILFQLGSNIDVPVGCQVADGLKQVRKAILPKVGISQLFRHCSSCDDGYQRKTQAVRSSSTMASGPHAALNNADPGQTVSQRSQP